MATTFRRDAGLALAALGIIYGDIGTSPLYAMNEMFAPGHGLAPTPAHAVGAASLILWLLILVVCVKYATFVLQADHDGEGGAFALWGILQRYRGRAATALGLLLMFAAGLLFGEGIITPAISVLSAVEGLRVVAPSLAHGIVPLTLVILAGVFVFQRFGTGRVGRVYGPVMLAWFLTIGWLGARQVAAVPSVLLSIADPRAAFALLASLSPHGVAAAIGAAFLAVTGSEALYADLGHLGRRAVRIGWFGVVFPALILNYAGQGAYLLQGGTIHGGNLFYSIVPDLALPVVLVLATAAAVIASVALVFGIYSLVSQAIALGLFPRLLVRHTDRTAEGRIYIPAANWVLCAGSMALVVVFGSTSRLAAAYGLAVAGVMTVTSLTLIVVAMRHWQWHPAIAAAVFGAFTALDSLLLAANGAKFLAGGYVPLLLGIVVFVVVAVWQWGRRLLHTAYAAYVADRDVAWFVALKGRLEDAGGVLRERRRAVVLADRAVVFLISRPVMTPETTIPVKLRVYLKRRGVIPRNILLLNIEQKHYPVARRHYEIRHFGRDVYAVHATFGFMEDPDVRRILRDLYRQDVFGDKFRRCAIEASEDELIIDSDVPPARRLTALFFRLILRWSVPRYRYFGLTGTAGAGLSKTVVPVHLARAGVRVEIPEFPLQGDSDSIDPDTGRHTNIGFTPF